MPSKRLKTRLLLGVCTLVIGSGILISLLFTNLYSRSLLQTGTAQAENVGHTVALEATDKILINDLVALHKMLNYHVQSNPSVVYLFIHRNGRVLAHTFAHGVPTALLKANEVTAKDQSGFQEITSTNGESYLDIATPIFGGKAGILHLGFSRRPYRMEVNKLWLRLSVLTLAILLVALGGSLLFVRRITRPLAALAEATKRVDQGELNVKVQVDGQDEVATLASSFNHMVARIQDYTGRLEKQTIDLERAHHQTRTFCNIVREIGSLRSLDEMGSFLIRRLQEIMKCSEIVVLIFNGNRDHLFELSARGAKALKEPEALQAALATLEGLKKVTVTKHPIFKPPLVPATFQAASRQGVVPLYYENHLFGALAVACFGDCRCNVTEMDTVGLILTQAAGVIKRAVVQEEEIRDLQTRMEGTTSFSGIVGKDPKMQLIYKLVDDISPTDASVLIQGESGTGKEVVARAIHGRGPRKDKPFVVINCSAYPATLLESELFGYEKGAFTGAIRQKAGRFEQAHGGTVFLDEIGEISPSAQIKLLRVIQTQKFERLGGEETLAVDVRILAATNKELLEEVKKGRFREDLFYRLNVIPIHLPLLRERPNDIPLLAHHFLRRFAAEQDKKIERFSPEASVLLLDYPWHGNVRELENSVEHATVIAKGSQIEGSDLPAAIRDGNASAQTGLQKTIVENERILLKEALEKCRWNKQKAARILGISRSTLYSKLRKYDLSIPTIH